MGIAIKAENISKAYQLGDIGTGTLSNDLARWVARIRGKEDPFLAIGETNDRTTKGNSDVVWSLKDINFEIQQGDAVGIIGRNGAGKSTLLKLLSKVTSPTTGRITGCGRVASLLEVGTGFHPELTGRENIYLNGAIMGMRKKEIARKFDEIVDFAGVERYIDTPVKRYSSGMYVRLAFAIAAHLESEILIVDEVLAVGDAEFQKKCLGKMGEVSKGEGRTVLFVSHNMGSIIQLCNNALLLNKGQLIYNGSAIKVIEEYLGLGKAGQLNKYLAKTNGELNKKETKPVYFEEIYTLNSKGKEIDEFGFNEEVSVCCNIYLKEKIRDLKIGITLQDIYGYYISTSIHEIDYSKQENDKLIINVSFPPNIIAPNSYYLRMALFTERNTYEVLENICNFKIADTGTSLSKYEGSNYGNVILDVKWK